MVLNRSDIEKLISSNRLSISSPSNKIEVEEASIKLHLSSKLLKYKGGEIIDLREKNVKNSIEIEMDENGYTIAPNELVIAYTREKLTLPNDHFGLIETSGSIANMGLQTNMCDSHIDPNTNQQITLQLKNNGNNSLVIYPDLYIIKMYLFKMSGPVEK